MAGNLRTDWPELQGAKVCGSTTAALNRHRLLLNPSLAGLCQAQPVCSALEASWSLTALHT